MKRTVGFGIILLFILLPPFLHLEDKIDLLDEDVMISTQNIDLLQSFIPMAEWDSTFDFEMSAGVAEVNNGSEAIMWGNGSHVFAFNRTGSLVWTVDSLFQVQYPLCGDFDRDGHTDDFYHNRFFDTPAGSEAYNKSGQLITTAVDGIPQYINYTASNNMFAVGDIDHDGYADDVVILFAKNSTLSYVCAYPYVEGPGNSHWNYSIATPFGPIAGAIQIGDLEGDGHRDDVVVMTAINWTYALNETGDLLWSYPAGGTGTPRPTSERLAIGDFNRDGKSNEVAVSSLYKESVFVIDNNGQELWNHSIGHYTSYLVVGDFDRDGFEDDLAFTTAIDDVLRVLRVVDGTGAELWNVTLPAGPSFRYISVADFDEDGVLNDIYIGGHSTGYIFSGMGDLLGRGGEHGSCAFGDFDGDGYVDDMLHAGASWSLRKFRFDFPQITFTPLFSSNYVYTAGWNGWSFNMTCQEEFPLDITFNHTSPHDTISNTGSIGIGTNILRLELDLSSGTYNISFIFSHEGAPFYFLTFEVEVSSTINSFTFLLCAGVISIVVCVFFIRKVKNGKIHLEFST